MNENSATKPEGFRFSKLLQYFLQGLLVIAPVTVTAYAIYWVVSTIDNLVPLFTERGADGKVYVQNYGLGFLLVIAVICLVGYLSSFFLQLKLFSMFDRFLEKTPGVRFIYSTVKDFFMFWRVERFEYKIVKG